MTSRIARPDGICGPSIRCRRSFRVDSIITTEKSYVLNACVRESSFSLVKANNNIEVIAKKTDGARQIIDDDRRARRMNTHDHYLPLNRSLRKRIDFHSLYLLKREREKETARARARWSILFPLLFVRAAASHGWFRPTITTTTIIIISVRAKLIRERKEKKGSIISAYRTSIASQTY